MRPKYSVHAQRVDRRDEHVEAQVELERVDEQRLEDVALDDEAPRLVLVRVWQLLLRPDKEDAVALPFGGPTLLGGQHCSAIQHYLEASTARRPNNTA